MFSRSPFYLKVCNLPFHPLKLNLQILCYHLNYYIKTLSRKKFLVKIFKFFKNKLLDTVTSSYTKIKSCRLKSKLSNSEAKALRNLTKQKDIIIQKADRKHRSYFRQGILY